MGSWKMNFTFYVYSELLRLWQHFLMAEKGVQILELEHLGYYSISLSINIYMGI